MSADDSRQEAPGSEAGFSHQALLEYDEAFGTGSRRQGGTETDEDLFAPVEHDQPADSPEEGAQESPWAAFTQIGVTDEVTVITERLTDPFGVPSSASTSAYTGESPSTNAALPSTEEEEFEEGSDGTSTPTQASFDFANLLREISRPSTSEMASASSSAQSAPGMSPSSSPRLPSPPPFTEVQFGPKSPTIGDAPLEDKMFGGTNKQDGGAGRRIRPGTRAADMASGPPLVPLSEVDSAFQLQEHLKALHYSATKQGTVAVSRDVALQLTEPPEGVERSLWLYELCRMQVQKINDIIVGLFGDGCNSQTCPEMRASEWQYLCAVHDPPKSCCAIDYCCHTLDWAGNILTSPKNFPSRLTLGYEGTSGTQTSMKQLTNIFRRIYRIFAHAWFQHRSVFWDVEAREGLYVWFKIICDMFQLIPEDNYTIPPEAEGDINIETPIEPGSEQTNISIFNPQDEASEDRSDTQSTTTAIEDTEAPTSVSTGATTRRHTHTLSTGSFVPTITESNDEEEPVASKLKELKEVEDDNTPVEGKGKVGEKTGEDTKEKDDAKGGELEKGIASLHVDDEDKTGGTESKDFVAISATESDGSARKPEEKIDEKTASDEPESEAKAKDEGEVERREQGTGGE